MTIDITSFFFNSSIEGATATAAWGTSVGQNQSKGCRIEDEKPGVTELLTGMLYKSISDRTRLDISAGSSNREVLLFSKFDKVYVNEQYLEDQSFVILLVRENTESHAGRLLISYPPYALIDETPVNNMAINEMASALGCSEHGCWFVHDISVKNQDELHFSAVVVNSEHPMVYHGRSRDRSRTWADMVADNISESSTTSAPEIIPDHVLQTIIFGTPGSGKSFKIKSGLLKNVPKDRIFRTTFHPDYDYASFVGAYKPISNADTGQIVYDFIPQVFTNAYVKAWRNPDLPIYLVIEEINRGNCAQIFGDLFQLLDRNEDGTSEYPIKADTDLRNYLEQTLGVGAQGILKGEVLLPANFHILATMNTSDQSLFPMDSAFKRRWAWEYVPIDSTNEKSQFKITIGKDANKKTYKWSSFLDKVNERIHKLSDSEDKQMGNFFIKSDVDVEEFKSKVMFYLWSEVCKEYENTGSFFKYKNSEGKEEEFTFNSLFPTNDETNKRLQGFMDYLGVEEA